MNGIDFDVAIHRRKWNERSNGKERGIKQKGERQRMKKVNLEDVNKCLDEKIQSFENDISLYRTMEPMAAKVAEWAIELIQQIRAEIEALSYEGGDGK